MYTVSIYCKPYVAAYLQNNYGNPVNLRKYKPASLHRLFVSSLSRDDDFSKDDIPSCYSQRISIRISESEFYKNGYYMPVSKQVKFNLALEYVIKAIGRAALTILELERNSLKKQILDYQKFLNLSEEDWAFDSMKKEFYRNTHWFSDEFKEEVRKEKWKKIIQNLSPKRTVENIHELINVRCDEDFKQAV